MGRSFHHLQSYKAGFLPTNFSRRSGSAQLMEHRASTKVLSLIRWMDVHCSYTINERYIFWFITYYIIQWSAVQAASSHSVFASSEEGL
jgi:hypothetical protein